MSKEIVVSGPTFHFIGETTSFIFYSDYTYRCNDWEHDDYNRWKIEGHFTYLRHKSQTDWHLTNDENFCKLAEEAHYKITFDNQVDEALNE